MTTQSITNEIEIRNEDLSDDQLEAAAGGRCFYGGYDGYGRDDWRRHRFHGERWDRRRFHR